MGNYTTNSFHNMVTYISINLLELIYVECNIFFLNKKYEYLLKHASEDTCN